MKILWFGLAFGLLPLAAPAQMNMSGPMNGPMGMSMPSPAAQITVSKPWIRYLLPNLPAAAYMVLHNAGALPASLTGATSPACGMVMLHESTDDSGMAMMTDISALPIPANGSVTLAPGGYHLMCMQPKLKTGTNITVTLDFKDGTTLPVTMPVYGPAGAP